MAISEKTFELNITHEILAWADHLWHLIGTVLGPRAWVASPPTAVGLTLRDEQRRGWDVRIDLPFSFGNARCLFLQYKAPHHRGFTRRVGSSFRGNWKRQRPHCQFGINNNATRDQHILLRALASNPSCRGAVLYGFPRLTTPGAFKRWAGRMTLMTTFLSVHDLDNLAQSNGTVIRRGHSHELRVSYDDLQREVHSTPLDVSELRSRTAEVLAEFCVVRAWRALEAWAPAARSAEVPAEVWRDVAEGYLTYLRSSWEDATRFEPLWNLASSVTDFSDAGGDRQNSYASVMRNIVVTVDDIVTTVSERLRPILASMLDGEWPSRVPDEPAPAISLRLTSETSVIAG